jgi:uncharacterized protein (TIGR00369 family)
MKSEHKAQWRSHPPFYRHLGLELDALADGKSAIRLPFRQEYGNTRGEVHGGAIATLVDAAMSQAVRSTVEQGARVATISMTINYLAPGVGDLLGRGTVIRSGRSLSFVEAEVTDAGGTVVCRATATFRAGAPKKP